MDNFTPKYIIIQNYIIDMINNGNLGAGDKLPSENELAAMFNVSRVTANKAIAELNILGIVERIQGTGTFVKEKNKEIKEMSHILSESFKVSSEATDFLSHKVEKVEIIRADETIADKLDINPGEEVCKIVRIMESRFEPAGLDYTYIPAVLFNGSFPNKYNFPNELIHEYLRNHLHLNPKCLHIHIDAKMPDNYEIKVLNIPKDKPLVVWDNNVIGQDNKILAYTTTIAKVDKYRPFINFELK